MSWLGCFSSCFLHRCTLNVDMKRTCFASASSALLRGAAGTAAGAAEDAIGDGAAAMLFAYVGPVAATRGAPVEELLPELGTFFHRAGLVVLEPQVTGAGIPTGPDGGLGTGGKVSHKMAVATSMRPAARSKAMLTAELSNPISDSC